MPVLRVRATLHTPIALAHPLHLDGLLAAAAVTPADRERLARTSDPLAIHLPPIPLMALDHAGEHIYLTSEMEAAPEVRRSAEHVTRRRDPLDLDYLTRPIETRSGPGRDVLLRFPTLETPWVEWRCVAHRRPLLLLLRRRVEQIGMLRRHGYGVVQEWEVERVEEPVDQVLVVGGRARRHLPVAWCDAPEIVERVPVRAPYWHPSTVVDGVRAGRLTGLSESLRSRLPTRC